jgi:hypothetical protein
MNLDQLIADAIQIAVIGLMSYKIYKLEKRLDKMNDLPSKSNGVF